MEIFGDSSVDNYSLKAINMTPLLQEPKPKVKKKRKVKKIFSFVRRRSKNNSKKLSKKQNTLETLHKLCKPVVVSVIRLSVSEIKQWCEKDSSSCQVENVSTQSKRSKSKHKVQKSKKFTRKKENKQSHLYSKNEMKSPNTLFSQETDIRNKKLLVEDLLRNVKQPYMKLQRIDEVINKIAQSFAKTTTECEASIQTECKTNVQTEEIKETANRSIKEIEIQTELNVFVPEVQKLPLVNINTDECSQNLEIEKVAVSSHINETLQLNECTDSNFIFNSDTEIVKNTHKKCFKRKCKVICDSNTDNSNDNTNSSEIILNEVKKLRMNLPEKINKMNVINEKHDVIKAKCIDENSKFQVKSLSPKLLMSGESDKESLVAQENVDVPLRKLDILEKLARICDPDNDDTDDNDDSDNINKNAEKDNTSSSVPSILNFECVAEDSASMKMMSSRNDDSIPIEKSVLENKEIQESMQESFCSDKDFLQRYKIFKELKIFLIKLDALKNLHTKHSATEIEKITNKLMNSFVNLNSSKIQHNNQRSIDKISFTLGISKDSNVNFEKSIVCTIPEKMQIVTKLPKNSSEKSSPNLIRNMEKKKRLKIKKASHNLRKIFDDKSKNRQHVSNLKQNSNVPTPTTKSSSQKSTNKTSELSNMMENVNINKSIDKMSSLKKQKPEVPSTENSVKSVIDAGSPEKIEINTPQINNFKSHFSNQSEKFEQTTFVLKTYKKSTNVTATNISASTCHSSPMYLKKHNKPKDKKDTYKCIVCDSCFENYSNLQQHLIIHTQKQNDSSLSTSNSLAEKSEETISQSSEAKVPELSQMSEHNVEHESLQCENNKQQKEKNTIPRDLLNKKKRKNKIKLKNKSQCTSHSNECSICLKIFPTMTDLAAHIFLHTEKELREACKHAKQKLVESESTEREKCKQTRAEQTEQIEEIKIEQNLESVNSTVDNIDNAIKGIHEISDKEESFLVQKSSKLITKDPEIKDKESTALKEHDSESVKLDLLSKSSKDKINKIESNKRAFTVCKCHNKPGTNENSLQIEIVLLCHTCKVLFRSIECFETHYRLLEYTKCNQNRSSSRSPNLFCANCGMIFSSVQDVRHHLEIHVRFKQNYLMDFRCNICKVIFLGIGTLFYIHWSKHSRNPFWIASEQSFPRHSIINSKLKKIDNLSTQNAMTLNSSVEQYIQVAEYVCNNCKLPFVTQDDLKNHDPRCKEFKTLQDTSVVENSNSHVIIRINCSLCNDIFIDKKKEFYNHIKNKHNCNVDPQFVRLSFSVAKMVYICNACMVMIDNLDAFENHWLKHNTTHINFTCTHCNNIYYNNLNSFIDHAEEHKSDTNVVSCTVNYTKAKFTCKFCNIGFDSSQDMYEHIITHNTSNQQTYSKIDQITNQDNPASQTNCTSSSVKNIGKEIEKFLPMEAQVIGKVSETSPGSNIDKDKEKLIRVLEGSEDDSENELIIDLTRQPEESNEISTGKENREKQTTSNLISDESSINQTCEMSENNITKTLRINTNVQVSSQNIPLSESTENVTDSVTDTAKNINSQISLNAQASNSCAKSTSVLQNLHSNNISNNNLQDAVVKTTNNQSVMKDVKIIENNESHDTILTENKEELTTLTKQSPKKQSSPRPKGYLRVKTLAELTGSAHFCKLCNCAIENTNEAKHFENHNTSNKDNNDHEIRKKELTSKLLETKFENPLVILKKKLTKSNIMVINSQKPQQLQINTNQDRHLPSLQNVTSAYHKNLPPCNFVRTTIAMSRSATSKSDGVPIKVTANTSNIPNSHSNMPYEQRTRVTSSINENKQNPAVMTNSSNHSFCQKQNLEYWTQGEKLEKIDNRSIRSEEAISKMNQNSELYQQTIQTRIECAPSSACSQNSSFTADTSNNSNQTPKKNQARIVNQPTKNTSSIYYKSPRLANGGMSIVINQTAPIQNIPTIDIIQQSSQQLYQHQVYSEPVRVMNTGYVQQSQNLVDCSESNSVYQLINNQYEVSNKPDVTTYTIRYLCPYCVKNYTSQDLVQIHINNDHNFICNICNLRLYNLNDLYLHKLNHNVNLM